MGAPLLLGFVLGPMLEENFRRSLLLSHGDFSVFFSRPLSLALLVATAILVVIVALPSVKKKCVQAFQEEQKIEFLRRRKAPSYFGITMGNT